MCWVHSLLLLEEAFLFIIFATCSHSEVTGYLCSLWQTKQAYMWIDVDTLCPGTLTNENPHRITRKKVLRSVFFCRGKTPETVLV